MRNSCSEDSNANFQKGIDPVWKRKLHRSLGIKQSTLFESKETNTNDDEDIENSDGGTKTDKLRNELWIDLQKNGGYYGLGINLCNILFQANAIANPVCQA